MPRLLIATTLGTMLFLSRDVAAEDALAIARRFSGYDLNQDGIAEIESLTPLSGEAPKSEAVERDKLLLVVVESRLLENDRSLHGSDAPLRQTLEHYERALALDGWFPLTLQAKVHASERSQDGLTVLAMRRLFQALKERFPRFAGAVLVGSFPETMLVRRWIWKRSDRPVTFGEESFNAKGFPTGEFLAIRPELIAKRSDVVLCDLEGNWESLYRMEPTVVESITVMPEEEFPTTDWPRMDQPFETSRFSVTQRAYADFFFINDSQYDYESLPNGKTRFRGAGQMLVPETGGKDLSLPNPLATPDVMVSRINPLHVAVAQAPENLDETGKPKAIGAEAGSPALDFQRDPALELQLLQEYFERNLSHRRGETELEARRVALLTTDLQTPSKSYFAATSEQLASNIAVFSKSTAVDFVKFLATPAMIKGVSAHSDPSCSILMPGYQQAELDALTGGSYWHWKRTANQFVPTYNDRAVRDKVHFALLRTLWANDKLANAGPAFFVHGGCEAICPRGADRHPFNSPEYSDHTQIAECLMYYGNGLALIGRAKVYFDIPIGFGDVFKPGEGVFGDVLTEYFRNESANRKLARSVASRNRSYFWSILGDWTLRMQYPALSAQAPAHALQREAQNLER